MKYSRLLSLLVFVGSLSAGTIPDWLSISGEVRARYEMIAAADKERFEIETHQQKQDRVQRPLEITICNSS